MKRITGLMAICIMLFAVNSLFAGEPKTQQGDKALFWGFKGLSDLSVNNSVIGGQFNIANRIGLYAALGISSESASSKLDGQSSKDVSSETGIALELGAKLYLFRSEPVAMFVSPMISIGTGSEEDKTTSSKTIDSFTAFSIGAGVGAEWWFTNNVSLSAATYLMFNSVSYTNERGNRKDEHTNNFFGTKGSNLGSSLTVSFYF